MKPKAYNHDDKMIWLIADNFSLLQIMSRFGIKVGFGDKTVSEVCADSGVDCQTFLTVVNFVINGCCCADSDAAQPEITSLIRYLRRSHDYFLEFSLPAIRRKLLDGIRLRTSDVSFLILKFFDEYSDEVRTHMEYEEKTVFGYIDRLLDGKTDPDYRMSVYSEHHSQVSTRLRELKKLILKYCPADADVNLLNAALYDIYHCERELENHCLIEDNILVPAIAAIERRVRDNGPAPICPATSSGDALESIAARISAMNRPDDDEDNREQLSQREKEIVALVVKGLTNKDIAEKLYISPHTVITHRRNIARKLDIHSATGLTIYAIVNSLVNLDEIRNNTFK